MLFLFNNKDKHAYFTPDGNRTVAVADYRRQQYQRKKKHKTDSLKKFDTLILNSPKRFSLKGGSCFFKEPHIYIVFRENLRSEIIPQPESSREVTLNPVGDTYLLILPTDIGVPLKYMKGVTTFKIGHAIFMFITKAVKESRFK